MINYESAKGIQTFEKTKVHERVIEKIIDVDYTKDEQNHKQGMVNFMPLLNYKYKINSYIITQFTHEEEANYKCIALRMTTVKEHIQGY